MQRPKQCPLAIAKGILFFLGRFFLYGCLPDMQNLLVLCLAVAQRSFIRAQGLLIMVQSCELLREACSKNIGLGGNGKRCVIRLYKHDQ